MCHIYPFYFLLDIHADINMFEPYIQHLHHMFNGLHELSCVKLGLVF